ncbi:MAG: phosphoribosylformylglycinamidine synthase I [Dethiosulfovibrio peptidovorans]|nr:MAG: phosphoribosylformylglycinamidine synthase I [Dethiosulfovibrio peptidovorans]
MNPTVVVFPGSNCDRDVYRAIKETVGISPHMTMWHRDRLPEGTNLVILPGGFSYGDYLRCGAIAKTAPIMADVRRHAERGGLVLGICNGFQILTEAGLLPGALLVNRDLTFICRPVVLRVERNDTAFTGDYSVEQKVTIPIAHYEGRYHLPKDDLKTLESNGQVVFRYDGENPNGALNDIAGVINEEGNVLGMMPHPERYTEAILGGEDGAAMWTSLRKWIERTGG